LGASRARNPKDRRRRPTLPFRDRGDGVSKR